MSRPVQQLLCGMPERRAVLVAHQWEGQVLVSAGGVGLVGPYRAEDTGARNLGMVMLTQMGFGVGQVAEAFGLRPGTVSHLRTAFGRGGSAALVKTSGRPAALTEQVVAEVRRWLAAGASQQQAAALVGLSASPELHTLRPRLAAIADGVDVLACQRTLATAMLRIAGQSAGIFYVDDHFVPYGGAKPVAKGHNGKRGRTEKGRADTLLTDERGRAVCFTTGEPSHLSKTMQPALRELRQIIPAGKILLAFDRGGAYAEAFTACRQADIDFITYRRGDLAPTTAPAAMHRIRRDRGHAQVILADEQISFPGYDPACRQLTLYEREDCTCPNLAACPHLEAVLQVLTSEATASAPDLLLALKGRWVIENAFKYLDFYGIDWLVDYHAEIAARRPPARRPNR